MPRCDHVPVQISVIVPTYRRAKSLERCLDALCRQTAPPDEIIVVVRREDRASSELVCKREDGLARVVLIDVPVGRPGLVIALNAGTDESRGDIVCLTDDDAEPRMDWLERIVATFEEDPMIGAVGGRDWIHWGSDADCPPDQPERIVGTMSRWGRFVGHHHLGIGPARDVAVLKGVNLSARGTLIRKVRFDTRLRGIVTEHHWEVGLCLSLARMGYRIVYDPAIAVDHYPQPRLEGPRTFGARQIRDASHNETLALLGHLPPCARAGHLLWAIAVGSGREPGLLRTVLTLVFKRESHLKLLVATLTGRFQAVRTHLRQEGRQSN
jgi:GT2 family glycosyltransferase